MELTLSQNIKNTSTSERIHPEPSEFSRRPQTFKEQETSINQVGQKEKDKERIWMGLAPYGRTVKRKGSYSLGSPLHGGRSAWTKGSFRALEESSETGHGRQN